MQRGRVLVAKLGLDGHTTGAAVVARGLRDAGFEVINLGTRVQPAVAVAAAMQEDVDAIGASILSGAHVHIASRILAEQQRQGVHVPVVVGGTIPGNDADELRAMGIAEVFGPGSAMDSIISCIDGLVARRANNSGTRPVNER